MTSMPHNGDKRRDRHDIAEEILRHARKGRIKTHIMYKAKLSYAQLNEYLPLLIEKGLLEENQIQKKRNSITLYRTTSKGHLFLQLMGENRSYWDEIDKQERPMNALNQIVRSY